MKILIATDMEGITGVTNWDQVDPNHAEYPRFRRLMTGDVNAAIRGVCAAGIKDILVTDGHDRGTNLLIEELDPCAQLVCGDYSPLAMVQGVDQGVDGVIFIGYHARAGSQNGILDHTWSSRRVANLWLNEVLVGEYGLNGAVAGYFNAPVLMLTGDQTVCAQASELLGTIETVVVKTAVSRMAAVCLPPQVTEELIQKTAMQAVKRLEAGEAPKPYTVSKPVKVTIDFNTSDQADQAAIFPGATRLDGRRLTFIAKDMLAAYLGFQAAVALVGL
ncbi:MAG: peptide ABC transporter substrate-binding protein [Anaerolineales bacterium]|nr:peptide ABC transporter substrate-binding protein [Anaerolineae bacterium]PWB51110.1 MAG: peptide ABC transporter substrate-binding protein [Anaerolineales bacterium]